MSSRCGLVTLILISPGRSSTRRMSTSSAGGGFCPTISTSELPVETKSATIPTSATIGSSAQSRQCAPFNRAASEPDSTSVGDLEEAHPTELRELALVRVEHEDAGVVELDLHDPALALAEHHRVRVLEVVGRAGRVVAEELAVQVQGVDEVELSQVRQVDPHELALLDPDRVLRVVEGAPVDRVAVVLPVAVRLVAVHHHHELARRRPGLLRVDDECAVEALVDVLLQRRRMAVVELHPGGAGRKLVPERVA